MTKQVHIFVACEYAFKRYIIHNSWYMLYIFQFPNIQRRTMCGAQYGERSTENKRKISREKKSFANETNVEAEEWQRQQLNQFAFFPFLHSLRAIFFGCRLNSLWLMLFINFSNFYRCRCCCCCCCCYLTAHTTCFSALERATNSHARKVAFSSLLSLFHHQ